MAKGNFIEAEGLVKKLNEAFTDHVKVVQLSVQTVKSLNDEYKKLPSDYAKGLKDVTESYNKSAVAVEKLKQNTQKLVDAKAKLAPKTSEEIVNGRALAQNADRQTRATSALVGAYANLNAKHQQASTTLQNLIARGKLAEQTQRQYNAELRKAQIEFDKLNRKVYNADIAVGKFNRNVGNYPKLMAGIGSLMAAFGVAGGLTIFAQLATDAFKLTKELQGLNKAMLLVTGSQTQFMEEQEFVKEIANDFGIELVTLTRLYTQFYVSAKDKLSSSEIQGIFRSVSKAASSMGLTVQQQERAFLALNQMMSKGVVSSEELRQQLGEALPGAISIMEKALGVTSEELAKMLKAGEVLASDALPKFARQLEKTYGIENVQRIDNITSAQSRLSNSFTEFIDLFTSGEGAVSRFFISLFGFITTSVNMTKSLFTVLNEILPKTEKQSNLMERQKGIKEADVKINSKLEIQQEKMNKLQKEYSQLLKFKGVEGYDELIKNKESEIKIQEELNKVQQEGRLETARSIQTTATNKTEQLKKEMGALVLVINGEKANAVAKDEALKKLQKLAKQYNYYAGQLEYANSVLADNTKKETESVKALSAAESKELDRLQKEKERLAEEELKRLFQLQKMKLESEKRYFNQLSKDEGMYYHEREEFITESLLKEIEIAELNREEGLRLAKGNRTEEKIVWEEFYKEYESIVTDSEERILKIRNDKFKEWTDNVEKYDGEGLKLNLFGDDPASEFDKWREKGKETLDWSSQDWMNYSSELISLSQELANTLMEIENQRYQNRLNNLENEKNKALLFAGESATARAEIERQYEERRAQIQRRQAQAQKRQGIFNAVINTAQGIMQTIAQNGMPAAIPFIALISAIGAAQVAMISSQQIPEFYKGTNNAPEGMAWTQERGAEIITDKSGKVKSLGSNKGAQLTKLSKGDKVFTAKETKEIMFNNELNGILTNNGISNASTIVNNSVDLSPLNARLDNLTKVIQNKPEWSLIRDVQGERLYQKEQGNRKLLVSNRLRIKG